MLHDRVSIITGGASGIGRASAYKFAEHGARILIADVDESGGAETASRIVDKGGDAVFVRTDVSSSTDVERMAATALDRWGKIDILFNNAAATQLCNEQDRAAHELDEWVWDKMMAVSLKSVYLCGKYCLPAMMDQRSGAIINVTSIDAVLAEPGFDSYTAAKGGVISLTRSLAAKYGAYNIRANVISPGYIVTECQRDWFENNPDFVTQASAAHALQRLGQPDEIANVALFLASDLSSFVTGALIPVDGGYTAFQQLNADQIIGEAQHRAPL